MGRPRTPSALKLVAGTDRADRRNANEPEPDLLADLAAPEHLHPRSAAVWNEVAPMLRRVGLLTVVDVIALELLCDAVADYRLARGVRGDDLVAKSAKTGSDMLSQWMIAQLSAGKRAEAMMSRFGMDPQSRSRVMINPQGDLFGAGASTPSPAGAAKPAGPDRFFGGK